MFPNSKTSAEYTKSWSPSSRALNFSIMPLMERLPEFEASLCLITLAMAGVSSSGSVKAFEPSERFPVTVRFPPPPKTPKNVEDIQCDERAVLPEIVIPADKIPDAPIISKINLNIGSGIEIKVIQQPPLDPAYVSGLDGISTQFELARKMGVISFLAHVDKLGTIFYNLHPGDTFTITKSNDETVEYVIESTFCFKALSPQNVFSNFVQIGNNLIPIYKPITAGGLFGAFYVDHEAENQEDVEPNIVFQTCIRDPNDPKKDSWGRYFVKAKPVT